MLGNEGEISEQGTSVECAQRKNPEVASAADEASIGALPDAVLQYCFSFIGKGHYRYVAGTSLRFDEIYSINHEKKTTRKLIAASVSSAELRLQDAAEEAEESTSSIFGIIFRYAALIGNVKVLKWAHDKGHEPEKRDFERAAINGHVAVLQWAQENNVDWFSDTLVNIAAHHGYVHILEWLHSTGQAIPVGDPAYLAASYGQCAVLNWLKDHDLLGSIQELWLAACVRGHIDVFDWLLNNGYSVHPDVILCSIMIDRRDALLWAREHGLAWDTSTSQRAALYGNLSLLQWLREHDCPWDRAVVETARRLGREEIAQWAIDNGCPTE